MKNTIFCAALASAILAFLSGCMPQVKPLYYRDELYSENKPVIYILPLADIRPDTSGAGNFDRWAAKTLASQLKRKGYKTVRVKDRGAVDALEEDQLRGLRDTVTTADEQALIAKLGPANARWMLLPVLQDFRSKAMLGCKATADVCGYLLDRQTGRTVLWHKAQGDGSVGFLLCPMAGQMATESAFSSVAFSFPKNPFTSKQQASK